MTVSLRKRMSEKWPSGGIGRLSTSRTPGVRGRFDVTFPGEIGPPAELSRCRREPVLERAAHARLSPYPAHENDFAARLQHAGKLIKRALGVGNRGDDVLRDDDIKRVVRELEALRVHHRESFDVRERKILDAAPRLAQHLIRDVDADDAVLGRIVGQRYSGADADLENPAADPLAAAAIAALRPGSKTLPKTRS